MGSYVCQYFEKWPRFRGQKHGLWSTDECPGSGWTAQQHMERRSISRMRWTVWGKATNHLYWTERLKLAAMGHRLLWIIGSSSCAGQWLQAMREMVRGQLTSTETWIIIRQVPDECVLKWSKFYLFTTALNHLWLHCRNNDADNSKTGCKTFISSCLLLAWKSHSYYSKNLPYHVCCYRVPTCFAFVKNCFEHFGSLA